ncbi:copper resistance protein CopC [Alkalihalophilus lindianensis]|uniref:Copper resistance protein CopC n=1 Tax=Alkalihalophilus lindianensis TaxID=1630542 RepID=A0ABU3X8G3_9BACI|nr:copper resistance protein CopC [Alkalihalophilus lindianensis]MDV2683927.1 copper resistance protein CopC [Alkalihalophilus lindianensis]
MKKLLILVVWGLIMITPTYALAHSYVSESSPADGEVVHEAIDELQLLFNGGIEQFSTVTVTKDGEEEIRVEDILIESPSMYVALESPLEAGTYTVDWVAMGADTHQTEGSYSFSVDEAVVNEAEIEETPQEEEERLEEDNEEILEDATGNESEAENAGSVEESTVSQLFIIAAVSVAIFIFFALRRKGRSRQ